MAPCVEFVKLPSTEAYRSDPTVVKDCIQILLDTPGLHWLGTGNESQDPNNWYIVNVWESQQHHQDLIDNETLYSKLKESLFKGASDLTYLYHVTFNLNEPYNAVNAPITEIVVWTLHPDTDKEVFTTTLNKLITLVNTWDGVHKGGWGPVVEDEKKYVVLLGWNSLEDFHKLVNGSPEALQLIGQLKSLADLDLKHTVLSRHTHT